LPGSFFFDAEVSMTTTATAPAKQLLSLADIAALTGAHRKSILAWVRAGQFPKPLPLGRRKRWWNAGEVEQALAGRSGGRAQTRNWK
jgi:predicted DNA-binding transcriptional regulator AlpA